MCIENYLWISFLYNKGVLQNNCFKIRKGLFFCRLKVTILDSPHMPSPASRISPKMVSSPYSTQVPLESEQRENLGS